MNENKLLRSFRDQIDALKQSYPDAYNHQTYFDSTEDSLVNHLRNGVFSDEDQEEANLMIKEIQNFIENSRPATFPGGSTTNC